MPPLNKFFCKAPEVTITTPNISDLVTVRNVPMISTGIDYPTSTGLMTFTEEDLLDIIASQDDPAIHPPRTKIGHTDPRFNATVQPDGTVMDGEPSLGTWLNLRLGDNNQTVYGDIMGVPRWFANIVATAYPSRSVEGNWDVKTVTGHEWRLAIEAVALLGVIGPGVTTLEDLPTLFSEEGPEGVQVVEAEEGDPMSVIRSSRPLAAEADSSVIAQVNLDDVRRSYYDSLEGEPGTFWWWIRAIYVEPNELIVDDDEGGLYRVPFTVNGDEVEFGDATSVKIQYVDQPKTAASAALRASLSQALGGEHLAASYDVRADSRPDTGGVSMTPEQIALLRQRYSLTPEQLPDNADDATVLRVLGEQPAAPEGDPAPQGDPPPPPPPPQGDPPPPPPQGDPPPAPAPGDAPPPAGSHPTQIPDGMVLVDQQAWEEVRTQAQEGAAVAVSMRVQERDRFLDDAIRAGKFPPSRREHYLSAWQADAEGTQQLIDSLSPGLVPVTARGVPGGESQTAESYDSNWLSPVERSRVEAARQGTIPNGNRDVVTQGGD